MKQIVYTVCDDGIDGREPTKVIFASLDEKIRDKYIKGSKNKNWLSSREEIHDLEKVAQEALSKLNGLERLALSKHF